MRTIGVAVPIPDPHASRLQAVRGEVGDPLADAIPAHITLLPPTVVDDDTYERVVEHVRSVAAAHDPFTVLLRGTGTFRPISPVVFVTVARGIGDCEVLEAAIRQGPIQRELEFAYHPHVTVAHHVEDAALDLAFERLSDYTAAFPVAAIQLYHHEADGVWRPQLSFPLGRDHR